MPERRSPRAEAAGPAHETGSYRGVVTGLGSAGTRRWVCSGHRPHPTLHEAMACARAYLDSLGGSKDEQ